MKSELINSDGLVREIEVEIDAEKVTEAFNTKYEFYKTKAKIPGFRPGKVTRAVLKQKYYDAIREEILQEMIQESYPEVVKEHELKVASMPDFPKIDLEEGKPLSYTVKFEIFPEIGNIKFDGLELAKMQIDVTDKEVNAVVEYMRKKAADFRMIDRAVEKTDAILCDLEKVTDPDNVLEESRFEDTTVDMDSEYTMPEFKKELLGVKAGDEKVIPVNYPPNYANNALAGHSITYKVFVKEVQERVLPIVDDAFAKSQGESETLLEMRLKIRQDLNKQKEHEHRQYEKGELIRQLVEKNEIPIPQSLIEKYIEDSMKQFGQENANIDEKTIRDSLTPMAEQNIRWSFIAEHITEAEKIEVLASDTENWIKSFADSYKMDIPKAKEVLTNSGRIKEIRNGILEDKIFDFLMTKVTMVDPPKDDEIEKATQKVVEGEAETETVTDETDNNITEEK